MLKFETLSWHHLLVPFVCFALRFAGSEGSYLAVLILCAYCLFGAREVLISFGTVWIITTLNPGMVSETSGFGLARYAVFISGFISTGLVYSRPKPAWKSSGIPTFGIVLFSLIILHSFLFSQIPTISVLKSTLWIAVFLTAYEAWRRLSKKQHDELSEFIFWGLIVISILSMPLIFLELGYLRNGRGFQGLLNHPQNFGSLMGLLFAWILSKMLANRDWPNVMLILASLSFALLILSQARTAAGASIAGMLLAMLIVLIFTQKRLRDVIPGAFISRLLIPFFLSAVLAISLQSYWIDDAIDFLVKGYQVEEISEIYEASRGGLIDRMVRNIDAHPFFGIGFGVPSQPLLVAIERDPVLGMPISVPIEKGVLPIMIIEELGFGLAILFFFWLWFLGVHAFKRGFVALTLISVSFLLNMGEATLLSAGGMGLILLLIITMAVTRPADGGRVWVRRRPG